MILHFIEKIIIRSYKNLIVTAMQDEERQFYQEEKDRKAEKEHETKRTV